MSAPSAPRPLPYQRQVVDYLRLHERELWQAYAPAPATNRKTDGGDAVRFELLKSTYRLERTAHARPYSLADQAREQLELTAPVTLYQAQHPIQDNASLAFSADAAHIVLHGPIADRLDDAELAALLGHELGHFRLWTNWDGEFLRAWQILQALALDDQAHPSLVETERLFTLYGEIFCDRCAYTVSDDVAAVVGMLVKIHTGVEQIAAADYLQQVNEILQGAAEKSEGISHPELYLRVRALDRWAASSTPSRGHEDAPCDTEDDAEQEIRMLLEQPLELERMDVLTQRRVRERTRSLIDELLAPAWMRTDAVLAHARSFFADYQAPTGSTNQAEFPKIDRPLCEYFCYVLLDFATADRDLERLPLGHAAQLAERNGWSDSFAEIARRELRLNKTQWRQVVAEHS